MTNKLPEVGKRYKRKGFEYFEIEVHRIVKDSIGTMIVTKCERVYILSNFFELFKEMPEQKLNRSNNTQLEDDHIVGDNKKVKEAKEELKAIIYNSPNQLPKTAYEDTLYKYIGYLEDRAQNLVNALESIKEPKTDIKEETFDPLKVEYGGVYNVGYVKSDSYLEELVKKTEESLPNITFADFIDYKTNNIDTLTLPELVLAISDYFQRQEAMNASPTKKIEYCITDGGQCGDDFNLTSRTHEERIERSIQDLVRSHKDLSKKSIRVNYTLEGEESSLYLSNGFKTCGMLGDIDVFEYKNGELVFKEREPELDIGSWAFPNKNFFKQAENPVKKTEESLPDTIKYLTGTSELDSKINEIIGFINQQEQTAKKVAELEKLIKEK